MPNAIVTQEVVEVLIDPQLPVYSRVSQVVVEVLLVEKPQNLSKNMHCEYFGHLNGKAGKTFGYY